MSRSISSRFRISLAVIALGLVSLGAPFQAQAKSQAQAQAQAQANKRRKKAPAATVDCKTDKDCVAVPDDCCPCSEGGKQHAIPKKEKASYEKDRQKRCVDTACTAQMSTDPSCSEKPFCGAGICELGG